MMASLFSGVSGLRNNLTKINVIGNNIANVNTIGFKGGRVTFREALVQTYKSAGRPSTLSGGTNPVQLGLGMQVSSIDNIFQQGGLETTGQITDLAIQGSGFFVLSDGGGVYYTRAGSFGFDANSTLVDPSSGLFVQGRMADEFGDIPSDATVGNIVMPFGQQDPAVATTAITIGNNLNSAATDSLATLQTAGDSQITYVSGYADDGAGGVHRLVITGDQAVQSTQTFTNVATDALGVPIGTLTENMTLDCLNITTFDDFELSIDNGTSVARVTGLTGDSTIADLVDAINQVAGVTAELIGGEINLTRDKAGDGASLNIELSTSILNTPGAPNPNTGNISGIIFGVPDGTEYTVNSGTDHTFVCRDYFTPSGETTELTPELLDIVVDDSTGLATGIEGLGDGGVTIETISGLSSGPSGTATAYINTADTIHSTSITVYDSLGSTHSLTIEFLKSPTPNTWSWTASFNGIENILTGGSGEVVFNSDGSLFSFTYSGGATAINFNPNNGADNVSLTIDAGTIGSFDGLTGFASAHTANIMSQDGHTVGILDQLSIDKSGSLIGNFTNGISRVLAQIVLADFNNQAGLIKAGSSLYQVSANSGEPIVGVAGETISAEISSGALEASSVDIASEFTGMITAQRGYQANARIITTSDDMLEELVNLKR